MIKLNGNVITPTIFPDKTSQVWKLDLSIVSGDYNVIRWDFENEAELVHLVQLKHLLDTIRFIDSDVILEIPYFPYARQDKEISNSTTFALISFCSILEPLLFTKIITNDIHSRVAFTFLQNLENVQPRESIKLAIFATGAEIIVFPDSGAKQRYRHLIKNDTVTINKERNQLTGELKITGMESFDRDIKGKSCLIVDDLCDGGGTFILAANFLRGLEVKEVSLYTTHGIYSKGTKILRDNGIKRIFNLNGEVHEIE